MTSHFWGVHNPKNATDTKTFIYYGNTLRYMEDTLIKMVHCKRCDHKWYPRSPNVPTVCPACHSPYWMKDRVIDGGK